MLNVDDVIDEIIADFASDLVDLSDDEIEARLDNYDLDPEDRADIILTVKEVRDAEKLADENPVSNIAKDMANEDGTSVEVTEIDKDKDGDIDKTVIKKENPDDDSTSSLSDEEMNALDDIMSDEEEDTPHEEDLSKDSDNNVTNSIARHLSSYRW